MNVRKGIADTVGRLIELLAPTPVEVRPLTEDDVASDRYLRRHQARGTTKRQSAAA